jgi:hypothetical protein
LAIGAGALVEAPLFGLAEGLNLSHDRATGRARLEYLPEKTPEHARQEEYAPSPTLAVVRRPQSTIRQEGAALRFDFHG